MEDNNGLPQKTGIEPIDVAVRKTLAWEQSHLSNPLVQVTLLGFAAYGIYIAVNKMMNKTA